MTKKTKKPEIEIFTFGKFSLLERPASSSSEWMSLCLRRPLRYRQKGESRKRVWWLGWDGSRLSRNQCAKQLAQCHPEIYSEISCFLKTVKSNVMEEAE